eukprot:GFUD01018885.1.p1 GENE.GFUD01018885.1~~GFUD01018885.1.p1  ORF type:complete len:103 (-),score=35.76 GFUD01018885.1:306-614(-)
MIKLKASGYKENFRIQILDSALLAFEKMVEEDKSGRKPLYRSRLWEEENGTSFKKNKKNRRYKENRKTGVEFKTVLFVPPTPGGELKKQMIQREEELNKFVQ